MVLCVLTVCLVVVPFLLAVQLWKLHPRYTTDAMRYFAYRSNCVSDNAQQRTRDKNCVKMLITLGGHATLVELVRRNDDKSETRMISQTNVNRAYKRKLGWACAYEQWLVVFRGGIELSVWPHLGNRYDLSLDKYELLIISDVSWRRSLNICNYLYFKTYTFVSVPKWFLFLSLQTG